MKNDTTYGRIRLSEHRGKREMSKKGVFCQRIEIRNEMPQM